MFLEVAQMAQSESLMDRVTGAVAMENEHAPEVWVSQHKWRVATAPGWHEKWAYAVNTGNADPGSDPGVITDADILTQVQFLRAATV